MKRSATPLPSGYLRVEQFVLHQQLADLGLQLPVVLVPSLRRMALQPRLPRGQKLIAPLRDPRCRDAWLPRHGLEILSAQQTQHHRALAPSRKPPLPVTLGLYRDGSLGMTQVSIRDNPGSSGMTPGCDSREDNNLGGSCSQSG